MNNKFEQTRKELLSFCTGEPVIATLCMAAESFDEYNLQVFVRSISDHAPTHIQSVRLHLILPIEYPDFPPIVKLYKTKLFHPNFSASGEWTDNIVRQAETIEDYLMRLIRVLQFKEINTDKVADRNAMAWYNRNINSGIFPTDRINYNKKPRIAIKRINNVWLQEGSIEVEL